MLDNFNGCHLHFLEIYTYKDKPSSTEGGGYHPPWIFFFPLHATATETDPG